MPDNLILASAFRVSVDVRTGRPHHSRRDAGATRTFRTLPFVRQIANNNQIACFWLILNPEQSHCARRFSATSKSHCICSCSPGSALWLQLGESIFPPCCWRALPCSSVDICSLRGAPSCFPSGGPPFLPSRTLGFTYWIIFSFPAVFWTL